MKHYASITIHHSYDDNGHRTWRLRFALGVLAFYVEMTEGDLLNLLSRFFYDRDSELFFPTSINCPYLKKQRGAYFELDGDVLQARRVGDDLR